MLDLADCTKLDDARDDAHEREELGAVCLCVRAFVYVLMYVSAYVLTYVCMNVCMNVCVYIYIYIYIYIRMGNPCM